MPALATDLLSQSAAPELPLAPNDQAVVVGLYGVPGSGKTTLLCQLKQELGQDDFLFYDGSEMIATVVPGGLERFQSLEEQEKVEWREIAINRIRRECTASKRVGVVAGHLLFWPEGEKTPREAYTQSDLATYTHLLYLDVPTLLIEYRCKHDTKRRRSVTSAIHLNKWQREEKNKLRKLCRKHQILFMLVSDGPGMLNKVSMMLRDFQRHTEEYNLCQARSRLDEIFAAQQGQLETVLVIDADRTLGAEDTGAIFWERVSDPDPSLSEQGKSPLKTLFDSQLAYSYRAFRQAVLMYEETLSDRDFDALCQDVASCVTVYTEFVSLLQLVAEQEHIGVVIVSCGLRLVWDKVLEREGLSSTVKVVGGGRIVDGFVVTAELKAALVAHLQDVYETYVWAFGDSQLDLRMLSKANQAIVIVGKEETRSKTMDTKLLDAINYQGLRARQVLLPGNVSPRLDVTTVPVVNLTEDEFVDSVLYRRSQRSKCQIVHATDKGAAKVLMTPARNALNAGPTLRKAHSRIGWYLATEFLSDMIGIEEYAIPHVQGHTTSGYCLFHERQTSIVALMRGGEPMALGINEAFPLAMFVHASDSRDIMLHHLQGQVNILLVDSVVNSGATVAEFVQRIRRLHATIRIVIVAGVVQAQSLSQGSLAQALACHANISVVALRLSDNKFTGQGTADTGSRLFNTTHLP